ncbi:hypothetical protein BURK2_00268 [Burkholderiales bacterium]|nr:hypothetical protein BURK2_00268 [Burkholderiales bacterium]
MSPTQASQPAAILALLASAVIWGVIWYPYRVLREAGIGGELATLLTYLVALVATLPMLLREERPLARPGLLVAIALAGAAANLGYVLALLDGRVMVVLLLFYLAPAWTVLLAWWLLGERARPGGAGIIAVAMLGAAIMLWKPESAALSLGWPEWLGLGAGVAFALCNVLLRRGRDLPLSLRTVALFAGVCLLAAVAWIWRRTEVPMPLALSAGTWGMIALLGLILMLANLVLQYGLAHVAANRAIVILLAELPVAALAAYLLAGESMRWADGVGGCLIVLAGLGAARQTEVPSPVPSAAPRRRGGKAAW